MTISDIVSLIALLVGVNAILATAIFFHYERSEKAYIDKLQHLDESNKDLIEANKKIAEIVDDTISFVIANDTRGRTYEIILTKLLKADNTETDTLERILQIFYENQNDCDRTLNELMLLSKNEHKKTAAFRQLSESCGNLDSIDKMVYATRMEPNEYKRIYEECICVLKGRVAH